MAFDSVESILNFAIQSEQVAADFYTKLADRMENAAMGDVFRGFAAEEMGHKAKLEAVKAGKKLVPVQAKVLDLKIADTLADVGPSDDLGYQEALIVAMKAEKAAFRLYTDLARVADDPALKAVLESLAQEEAKHKLRFEVEYDELILKEG